MSSNDALAKSGATQCMTETGSICDETEKARRTIGSHVGTDAETHSATWPDVEVVGTDAQGLAAKGSWQVRTRRIPS